MSSSAVLQLQQLYQLADAADAAAPTAADYSQCSQTPQPRVLDVRPKRQYLQQRLLHAVNIQLPCLTACCYLLPDKAAPFAVVVPSSSTYTVVQVQQQDGNQLPDGSIAVYLKGTSSLQEFLTSRGWTAATFLQDTPALWQAAQQLRLMEAEPTDEQQLARRCLFAPSQLLASEITGIEATLAERYCHQQTCHAQPQQQQQQQQQGQQEQQGCTQQQPHELQKTTHCVDALQQQLLQAQLQSHIGTSTPGGCILPPIVLHALDVGCGSGRDVAWLASRQAVVHLPGCAEHTKQQQRRSERQFRPECQQLRGELQEKLQTDPQRHGKHMDRSTQQQQQQQQQQLSACSQVVPVRVSWHVTGVDEWLGALERAHDLAAAMQLSRQQVELVVASVCPESGSMQLQRLPAKSKLHKATSASVVYADDPSAVAECATTRARAAPHAMKQNTLVSSAVELGGSAAAGSFTGRRYDLILCVRFLERALLPWLRMMLNPGGFIMYSTFVDGPGLRAFGRPSGPEHVLQPGELAGQWFGPQQGFAVLKDMVVLSDDGREVCCFVAQLCTD